VALVFGDCRLDLERRELRRGGEVVTIEPKAFDLLAYLVQHRDRVVSKDDLLQSVWGGRIVSESALTTRINAVRRALGDDGATQRLIRTFTRRGVRFVAEITVAPAPEPVAAAPPVRDKPSIAVLPFENLTGDSEQDYFVDGMVEEITTAIARFPWLSVIARNSSFTYKGRAVDVKQVARELDTRYVLEGSVRKAGSRVRIAGQLIDATTGAHIWAERFDGALDDVFALQDEVAGGVAGAVGPQLRLAEIARASSKPTDSLDAYDLYLRARARCYERGKEGLAEGVRLLQQALALDRGYASATVAISACRCTQRNRHWIPDPGPEIEEGIRMARQAIASARADAEVLTAAGFALAFLAGDNDAALGASARAIALNPNLALAWGHRALVLVFLDRPDEAIPAAEQAMRLSPRDPRRFNFVQAMAFAHLAAGRYEEGLPWAEEALGENAGLPGLRLKLSLCGHLGRLDEAAACLRRVRECGCEPTVAAIMPGLAMGLAPEILARMAEALRKAGVPEA
jgi:pentatricopeptide repeat protein